MCFSFIYTKYNKYDGRNWHGKESYWVSHKVLGLHHVSAIAMW